MRELLEDDTFTPTSHDLTLSAFFPPSNSRDLFSSPLSALAEPRQFPSAGRIQQRKRGSKIAEDVDNHGLGFRP